MFTLATANVQTPKRTRRCVDFGGVSVPEQETLEQDRAPSNIIDLVSSASSDAGCEEEKGGIMDAESDVPLSDTDNNQSHDSNSDLCRF